MARPPDPEKRGELLERCFEAAQRDGTLDLSLATLAAAAGTSARMLVYHFGSREGLHRALAARLEAGLRERFAALEASAPGGVEAAALALWDHLAAPEMRGLVRLALDVMHRAGRGDPDAAALAERESAAWGEFLAARVPDPGAAEALLLLVLGAAMDLALAGDPERGRRAILAYFRGPAAG